MNKNRALILALLAQGAFIRSLHAQIVDLATRTVQMARVTVDSGGVMTSTAAAPGGSSMLDETMGQTVQGPPNGGAMASGANRLYLGYYAGIDPVPPGPITDLAASAGSGRGQVNLSWTAVGNDADVGTAMIYDVRAATYPITDANAASAPSIAISTLPAIAGTPQAAVISGLADGTAYFFAVRAVDASLNASPILVSPSATTVSAPQAPGGLAVAASGEDAAGLTFLMASWSPAPQALSYTLQASTAPDFSGRVVSAAAASTSAALSDVMPAATYYLRVSAANAVGVSAYSAPIPAATPRDTTAPQAPALIAASSLKAGAVAVSWQASAVGEISNFYNLYRATAAFASTAGSTSYQSRLATASLTDLPSADGAYFYGVTALDASGNESGLSNVKSALSIHNPPAAPSALTALFDRVQQQISLSWNAPSSGTAAAYNVYRSTRVLASTNPADLLQNVTAAFLVDHPSTSFGSAYYYLVTALDAAGNESGPSDPASAIFDIQPPAAVTDLRKTAANGASGAVSLAWTVPSDDLTGVAAFSIVLSTFPDLRAIYSSTTFSNSLPSGATAAFTLSLSTQQATYLAVESSDGAGNLSAPSNAVLFNPVPPRITSISPQPNSVLSRPVSVSVQLQDAQPIALVSYALNGQPLAASTVAPFGFFWDTRRFPDGAYVFAATAVDANGNVSSSSFPYTLVYAPPPPPVILSPSNGFSTPSAAIAVSGTATLLTTVEVQLQGLDLATAAVLGDGTWSASVVLAAGGNLSLTALAFEPEGFSSPSNPVNVYFSSIAPQAPNLPQAEPIAGGGAAVSWSAPAGFLPAFYRVYRSTDPSGLAAGSAAPAADRVADRVNALAYTDVPASDGLYFYGVTNVDRAGNESALSDIVYVLTDRVPPTASIAFSTPTNAIGPGSYGADLTVSKTLSQVPILTWTPPGGAPQALFLSDLTSTVWRTTVTVTSAMASGQAFFAFQGVDLTGNVGAKITAGGTVALVTSGPVGAVAIARSFPVPAGTFGLTLALTEPAASTPTLSFTPQNGSAIPVVLAATGTFDGGAWSGTITITTRTGDGVASFNFSAADRFGNIGTTLSGGVTAFRIDTVAPTPPLALHALAQPHDRILLSWSAPLSGQAVVYRVYRDSNLIAPVNPASDGSGTYLDATTDGTHSYEVTAVDAAGNEGAAASATASAVGIPPAPPIGLNVSTNSFGQIQLAWAAGSTGTASYNLYRATFAFASAAGLSPKSAAPPYVDAPTADAFYYYSVTALDSIGNESAPSNQVSILFDQGAPQIAFSGVANGGFYNASVAPAFTVSDVSLATASLQANLNGQPFVSGSNVSAEGAYALTVAASNAAGHASTATVAFTIDLTAPRIAFSGVTPGQVVRGTAAVSVQITELHPGTSSFTLLNQTLNASAPYAPGAVISANGLYVLTGTAADLAGNVAVSSISFKVETGPLAPGSPSLVMANASATLSWTKPEPDVLGYRVYKDGRLLSASLFNGLSFVDPGYSAQQIHVYQVSAVDLSGVEGPKAQATAQPVSMTLAPGTLTRGFFDAIHLIAQNNSTSALSIGPAQIQVLGPSGPLTSAQAQALSAAAGQSSALEGDVATAPSWPAQVTADVVLTLPTDPGATASIAQSFPITVQDPAQPIVQVFPGALVPGVPSPVQVQLYNRGSAPMDVVTAQLQNSTSAPVDNVQVSLVANGTALASAGLNQTIGSNAALVRGRQLFFARIPPGQSQLFAPIYVVAPQTSLSSLLVQASVSTPAFNLPFVDLPGAEGYASSASQSVLASLPYTAAIAPDRAFYDQGSSVTLSGRAVDPNGNPVPNAGVLISVISNGFTRTINAVTNGAGAYAAGFFPSPTEAGVYTIAASYPAVVSPIVQGNFAIEGMNLQYADFTATLSQNSNLNFNAALINSGQNAISGITSSLQQVSGSGTTLSVSGVPASLNANSQASLAFAVAAATGAVTARYVFTVAESHGFVRTMPITINVQPALPGPVVSPTQLTLGLATGDTRTQVFTLKNTGFAPWQNVSVTQPTIGWVALQGSPNLGSIPPGGNASFTLSFAPPTSLGSSQYSPNPLVQLQSDNVPAIAIPANITVTTSRTGDAVFGLINADKPCGGSQCVPVPGGTVNLVSLDVSGLAFNAAADQNGVARFTGVPSGNYAWHASAANFQTQNGTLVLQPGVANPVNVYLPNATITYTWSVVPTSIQDVYNVALNLTFKTDVPAPTIVINPPVLNLNLSGGQTAFAQFSITNQGLVEADNYQLNFSGDSAMQVALPFTSIPKIAAGQTISVPLQITLTHASCHSGTIAQTYNYTCAAGVTTSASAQSVAVSAGSCGGTSGGGGTTAGAPGGGFGGSGSGSAGGGGSFSFTGNSTFIPVAAPGATPAPACSMPTPPANTWNFNASCPGTNPTNGNNQQAGTGLGFPHNSPAPDVRPTNNSMNPGWNPGVNPAIVKTPGGGFQRTTSNGSQQVFVPLGALNQPVNGSGPEFAQPVDVYDQLTALNVAADGTPGAFQERTKDGDVTRYDLFGSTYYPTLLTDRNGNTLAYTRDANGNLQKLTDIHGRYLSFSYDAQSRTTRIADSAGRSVAYGYDSAGDRIAETDPDGDVTQYAYDANHRITQVTYPNGGHHAVVYDGQGRVASESDDGGNNSKTYSYYASSTAVMDALGRVTVYGWIQNSGLRKINRITDPNGGVTSFAYDGNLNLTSQTDPLGRVTKFQYDATGNVTAATDADGQTTQTAYEPNFNQPTGVIDPKANKTSMSYDAKGNLTQTQDALGDLARMSYDAQGHVTATKDPLGNITAFAYDGNGTLTSLVDPLNRTINITNDALSRVTQNSDPAGHSTNFSYDAQGNLTQVTDALSGLTRYNYATGRDGRLLNAVTDAKNQSTTFGYDVIARLATIKNALNQAKSFAYDNNGNLTSITDAKGQTITLAYDNLDRLITKTFPEGNVQYQYDAAGNLTKVANYNGSVIQNSYDSLNNAIQVVQTLPGGFSATIGYSYDANGNRTSMTTPWGNC